MVQLPLYKTTIEENESMGSPDFTNGGAITIKRIPLNYFLKAVNNTYNPKSLDSLFFEKIPGDIIEKKYSEQANYANYDIKNITKTGNAQHSKFYITPLEIISISMTGPANYVRQYENEVFENIQIKPFKNEWEKIKPLKGGFEAEVPSYNFVFGNSAEKGTNIDIQAYDNQEKAYYFLREKTLNDTSFLENSQYEQKQIHYQFYLQQNQDSTATQYNKIENSFVSSSKIGDRNIKLKTVISGNKYYMLGSVNASEANTNRFFNSFLLTPFDYKSRSKILIDSIANYKIEIPEKENENLFLKLNKNQREAKNAFKVVNQYKAFNSETGRKIKLAYHKFPKYERTLSIDSVQRMLKKEFLNQYDEDPQQNYFEAEDESYETATSLLSSELFLKKGFSRSLWDEILANKKDNYEFLSESTTFDKEQNSYTINALISKPNATQSIKYKVLYKNNAYYLLNTLVEKNYKNDDPFIEKAFNSLDLVENIKTDTAEDKVKLFIEDAKSEKDTIRYSALNTIDNLDITKNDFDAITNFINTYNFKESETDAVTSLLEKIGKIDDQRVIPYLENYYKKESTKTDVQISILKSISYQKSKAAYKKINELLEYDLPISDLQYEIGSLFYTFERDPENSKELFPEIFQYYSIKEYNKPIISFCNSLLEQKLISVKKLKAFKKIILTNTKLEYKRVASWNEKNKATQEAATTEDEITFYSESSRSLTDLINYTNLIYNYTDDNAVKEVLKKIKSLDIPELNIELARLGVTHNMLNTSEIESFLNDPKTQFVTINLLLNQNKKDLIHFTDDEIAKSAALNFQNLAKKDSITLLKKQIVEKDNHEISFYFYQIQRKNDETKSVKKQLYTIAFLNENKKINPLAYTTAPIKTISIEEDPEKTYALIINETLNGDHIRASFEKEKKEEELSLGEEY
ncbi:hypothetical protein D3C85_674140 [compost metagenome]